MKSVKDYLQTAHDGLGQFETALRGAIVNQNIADIVASARAKLAQAASHPDAETELGAPVPSFEDSSNQGSN